MSRLFSAAALGVSLLAACSRSGGGDLATFADSASYALGMNMGGSIRMAKDRIQREALIRGLTDALDEKEPVLAEQDAMRVLRQFATQVQEADQRNRAAEGDVNRTSGDEFRAGNAARPGVQTTASGLQVEVLQAGTGARPTVTDRVTVHYRGTLIDGTEFDSSYKRGEPATFPVGQIIPGWTEALQMMNVGGKYKIVIPPDLAYGADGAPPDIGPNATLVFEIELVGIAQ